MDGPAGQPGEGALSRAMGVSSGVIARAPIPALRCLATTVSVTATRTGFVADRVARQLRHQVYFLVVLSNV